MELEERQPIDRKHVTKRLKDWKGRIDDLYSDVRKWLADKPEYTLVAGRPMRMFEELMEQAKIAPQDIGTADLFLKGQMIASFKPRGLWVIGANGRIDILTPKGSYTLIDRSDQFKAPKWHMYAPRDRRNGKPFNKRAFFEIL